jgi:RNA polymerase subunit RPABC4/transcription elongation factor Spt4
VANQKTYQFKEGTDVEQVVQRLGPALDQWFQQQEYETLTMPGGDGRVVVQAKKGKGFVQSLVPSALTVDLSVQDEKLVVQWGNAKWGLQAATGIVSLIIFWPVAAIPAWVSIKQKQLIDGALDFLSQNIASLGGSEVFPVAVMPTLAASEPKPEPEPASTCPHCGQAYTGEPKFCPNCGKSLVLTCSECGTTLAAGTKFCPECGTPTGE